MTISSELNSPVNLESSIIVPAALIAHLFNSANLQKPNDFNFVGGVLRVVTTITISLIYPDPCTFAQLCNRDLMLTSGRLRLRTI